MKTRDRILSAARRMFNALGYGNVTTAALAAEIGISEGNLWYHFRTKRDLLEAISEDYLAVIEARLSLHPSAGEDVISGYARLLAALLAEIGDYAFLYRDQADYGEHGRAVSGRITDLYTRTQAQLTKHHAAMVDAGHLDWPYDQLDDLGINATIILRFGQEYFRETEPSGRTDADCARRTIERHLTLFEDRLTPAARYRLRHALAAGSDLPSAA